MHPCVVALAAVLACAPAGAGSSPTPSDPPALVTPSAPSAVPAVSAPLATGTPLSAASSVTASSKSLLQPATAACLAASQLQRAKVAGKPVVFDDSLGTTAVLLSGRSARPKMKHLSGRELCLFDRKTGVAQVTDAENMGLARQ